MTQLSEASAPELRDGVEVFIYPQEEEVCPVLFLFLSNRRRLRIECKPAFALLLKELSKSQLLAESLKHSGLALDDETAAFLAFLEGEGIVTLSDPLETDQLPAAYVEQYKRQLYFLLDILRSPQKVHEVQKRIFGAHITVFGLGAVGSGILQQLCMMGFRRFTLVDYADVEENDIARTPYRIASQTGTPKTQAAEALVEDFAFDPQVELCNVTLRTHTDLDKLVQRTSLIVNTTDQPYVGYTNIKLSRYALQHDVPVLAAGGFDAHLASLGELLIPYVTPCADCYATFFHESLKDWKPIPHPVKEREGWFGGLGSLSTFSASTAALDILGYFMNPEDRKAVPGGRGEFLFHDYSLDTFVVERDKECQSCGEGRK
ncbi:MULTISPECIES: ThiF family adenylyltransferase [unclassified Pseudodesulfovibrio]|uniref:ThiF family adenylyltransferase n=1 Tax=unclassified Pseudodesulfovibrio TaxID=2661612 RepID=UPI000FEBA034|nr:MULTISPECIES: ThiF family adenylyltransferase [unclassified Pseudodesulfovibrio]MCJ2163442.1 ThiF family adenylyltransferase [Pseudodesulfovibrio sp. S3-i]RWU06678.1 ThiF family adenylyltransferase [Pseudodesulfovibrio sp. S3]